MLRPLIGLLSSIGLSSPSFNSSSSIPSDGRIVGGLVERTPLIIVSPCRIPIGLDWVVLGESAPDRALKKLRNVE
jgi:hypothetical protein